MYLHFLVALFITLPATQATPVRTFSNALKFSANDPNHKCSYLRRTKLIKPEPDFITKCTNLDAAISLTHLTKSSAGDALCLLYYINFEQLCHVTNRFTDTTSPLLSQELVDKAFEKPQSSLPEICEILKRNLYVDDHFKPGIQTLQDAFAKNKCTSICLDFDDTIMPVCSATAFIMNTTQALLASHNPVETKTERGAVAKPKPQYTEHVGDVTVKKSQESINAQGNPRDGSVTEQTLPEGIYAGDHGSLTTNQAQNGAIDLKESRPDEEQGQVIGKNAEPSNPNEAGSVQQSQEQQPEENINMGKITQSADPNALSKSIDQQPTNNNRATNQDYAAQIESERTSPALATNTGGLNSNGPVLEVPAQPHSNEAAPADANKEQSEKSVGPEPPVVPQAPFPPQVQVEKQSPSKDTLSTKNEEPNAHIQSAEDKKDKKVESQINQGGEPGDNKSNTPFKPDGGVEVIADSPLESKDPLEQEDADDDAEMGPGIDGDTDYGIVNEPQPLPKFSEVKPKPAEKSKPLEIDEDGSSFAANYQNQNIDDSESYFFSYFMMVCIMFICGYVAYHNKQKILALVVEGRKSRRPSRTRRPNSANYRKLDSNLEEAVTSSCNKNATQVIY